MSQELIEGTLNKLPHSEKTRELVTKWLNSLEENLDSCGNKPHSSSDHSGSGEPEDRLELEDAGYEDDSSDEAKGRTPVSIVKRKSKWLAGFISGFRSRGGKCIVANFKRGQIQILRGGNPILNIGKANCQGGANQSQEGAKAPPRSPLK